MALHPTRKLVLFLPMPIIQMTPAMRIKISETVMEKSETKIQFPTITGIVVM